MFILCIKVKHLVRSMVGENIYYPGDPQQLRRELQRAFLETTTAREHAHCIVAPYGAYEHSLRYITSSLKAVGSNRPELVVILAPSHSEAPGRVLLPESDIFVTPFGPLAVATEVGEELLHREQYVKLDEIAHLQNHSIEVLLPAIHYHYGDVPILPLLVGHLNPLQLVPIAHSLEEVLKGKDVRILIAANLSGFTVPPEADATSRKLLRLLMTAPGATIADNLATFESPPRSIWPLALGHILAGPHTRPHILSRGSFDTECEGDVGTVVFGSIVYLKA